MNYRRIIAIIITFCLIFCFCACEKNLPTQTTQNPVLPSKEETPEIQEIKPLPDTKRVAYIPLDDRPLNCENTVYLANSLGLDILMPEKDLFATRLNGQGTNKNGTPHGDPKSLFKWLETVENNGVDRYIISLDQLLSGGLVSSRDLTETDEALEILEKTVELLSSDEKNKVYFADSIMRLAPTVSYGVWTYDLYNSIRKYAMQPRLELSDINSIEEITDNYSVGPDGKTINPEKNGISDETLERYLKARVRKLTISDRLLDLISENDQFHVLYGIDDSSSGHCIQANEIAFIENRLNDGEAVLSGVDDLGFKLTARLYLDDHPIPEEQRAISVEYFGGKENKQACDFDFRPLSEIIENHIEYLGFDVADDAGLKMIVLTATDENKEKVLNDFSNSIDLAASQDTPIIITDACNNTFRGKDRAAIMKVNLNTCISYDGQNDMANVAGVTISRGIARYAYLINGEFSDGSDEAFMRTMTDTLIRDITYRCDVHDTVTGYVQSKGGDPNNFANSKINSRNVTNYLEKEMVSVTEDLLNKIQQSEYLHSLNPAEYKKYGKVAVKNYDFPWNRTFEINFDIEFN